MEEGVRALERERGKRISNNEYRTQNFEGKNVLDSGRSLSRIKPETGLVRGRDDGEGDPLRGGGSEYRITNPELRILKGKTFWIPRTSRRMTGV
jgi:hypothetical protein